MSSILVAGSIAYDMLLSYDGSFVEGIDTDHLDDLSVAYVTRHLNRHFGGTAANIAWNFALLGQKVAISGSVGHDGKEYLERLQKRGIDTSLVTVREHHVTPTAIIGTDSSERQITFFHPGADIETEVPEIASEKNAFNYVLISPHSATAMEKMALACQKSGTAFIFDPGQQSLQFSRDELRRIVHGSMAIIANAYEWSILREALEWTVDEVMAYTGLLVVTHGEHGVNIQTSEQSIQVDVVSAKNLVNPTGAGDALRAGFITGLSLGWDIRDCARLGAAIASFCVESEGTQMESLDIGSVMKRAEETYGEVLPEGLRGLEVKEACHPE